MHSADSQLFAAAESSQPRSADAARKTTCLCGALVCAGRAQGLASLTSGHQRKQVRAAACLRRPSGPGVGVGYQRVCAQTSPPARSRPSPSALHGPGCLPQAHLPAGARTQKGRCCRLARMRPLGSSESETGRGRGRGECFTGRFRLGKVLSRLLGTDGGDRRVLGASGLGVRGLDGTATAGISTGKGHSCPPPAPV